MTQISHLTLYHYPISRSARVKFLLHELLGDNFTTKRVDLMRGEGMAPEFLSKNPNHAVPVLEIDYSDGSQQVMIESGAMIVFLADAFPEKGLSPAQSDLRGRADFLQMIQFGASWMDMMLWQIRMHRDLLPPKYRHDETVKLWSNKWKNEVAPQLAARLQAHEYICGDQFSAADCLMAQNLNWGRAYGLVEGEPFKSYMARMKARPAFLAAFADAAQFQA